MRDQLIRIFEPQLAVDIINLQKSNNPAQSVFDQIEGMLRKHYNVLVDSENSTIYVKARKEKQ